VNLDDGASCDVARVARAERMKSGGLSSSKPILVLAFRSLPGLF
jgi:hypothetical protein